MFRGIALPAVLCHKESSKTILLRMALERKISVFCLLLAGSLWHKDSGILRSKAPSRGLWMPELVYLWHKTAGEAIPRNIPRHRGGPVWRGLVWP